MHRQIAGSLTGRVTKWVVLVAVLVITGIMAGFSAQLADVQNNEASSWLPESAESTQVLEELSETVDPNDIPTLVVYHREGGLTDDDLAQLEADGQEIAELDGVTDAGVLTPAAAEQAAAAGAPVPTLVAEDGEVAYLYFVLNFGADGWNAIPDAAEEIRDIATLDGGEVHLAGYGGQAADSAAAFEGIDTNLILATLGVVIVILLFTYRSPILWLLPIICAVSANFIATGLVYLLAKYADLTVNGQSQAILSILVIGAGTDYALLLVARYREELRRHEDRHEAMAFALHRAAPAIFASAATVAVGMLCLSFADLNSTAGLGPVAAIGVVVTLLVMVTLLPALLVICGRWVFWPKRPSFGSPEPTADGLWAARRSSHQPPAAARVDRHDRTAAAGVPGPVPPRRLRPVDRGHLHQGVRLHQGSEAARRARPGRQLQHHPGGDQRGAGSGRGRVARGHRRPVAARRGPARERRPGVVRGDDQRRHLLQHGRRHRRGLTRRRPRRRRALTRWSVVGRRSTSTPRSPPSVTAGSSCRSSSWSC